MARLPRLVVPGLAHYVLLSGHNQQRVVEDEADRRALTDALREAARARHVVVHAYAVLDTAVHLLLRPPTGQALSASIQNLGRRYVARFNQRHLRTGTLWDGRFRAAVLEPGSTTLAALCRIDVLSQDAGAAARMGGDGPRDVMLVDPPELWALGNTPFERELAYRELLAQDLSAQACRAMDMALRAGGAVGSDGFLGQLAMAAGRHLQPRPRGRPRQPRPG